MEVAGDAGGSDHHTWCSCIAALKTDVPDIRDGQNQKGTLITPLPIDCAVGSSAEHCLDAGSGTCNVDRLERMVIPRGEKSSHDSKPLEGHFVKDN